MKPSRSSLSLLLLTPVLTRALGGYAPPEGGFAETPRTAVELTPTSEGEGTSGYLGTVLDGLGWIYNNWLTRQDGPRCRYAPTCSNYARQALPRYGLFSGWVRSAGRLLRCHGQIPRGLYPIVYYNYTGILRLSELPLYPECSVWAPLNPYIFSREARGRFYDPLLP